MTESGLRRRAIVIFSLLIRVAFLLVTQTKPKPQNQKLARVHHPAPTFSSLSPIGSYFSLFSNSFLLLYFLESPKSQFLPNFEFQFPIKKVFFFFPFFACSVLGFFTIPCSCIFLLFYFDLHDKDSFIKQLISFFYCSANYLWNYWYKFCNLSKRVKTMFVQLTLICDFISVTIVVLDFHCSVFSFVVGTRL